MKHYALIVFGYLCALGLLALPEFEKAERTDLVTTNMSVTPIDIP